MNNPQGHRTQVTFRDDEIHNQQELIDLFEAKGIDVEQATGINTKPGSYHELRDGHIPMEKSTLIVLAPEEVVRTILTATTRFKTAVTKALVGLN